MIAVNIYGGRPKSGDKDVYVAGHNLLIAHAKTYQLYQTKYRMKQNGRSGPEVIKVSEDAKIRNRYNQVPHLTQDTNGKVTNSQ